MNIDVGLMKTSQLSQEKYKVASFPGLHAQLLSLAVRKVGEGLDGLIM